MLDPVMVATSGAGLLREEAAEVMKEELFSLAEVITPNIPEAEVLAGMKIRSGEEMEKAAEKIGEARTAVQCSAREGTVCGRRTTFSSGRGRGSGSEGRG